jgi:formylglycine-generating enzyme required for sulfatase activity
MRLNWCPPGEFMMGSKQRTGIYMGDDVWQRHVTLTRGFWLGVHPVTQAEYATVTGRWPSYFKGVDLAGFNGPVNLDLSAAILASGGRSMLPVEQVSWSDAMAFCRKLTSEQRASKRLPAGLRYTLPTEAQWEYACRAGSVRRRYGPLKAVAWCGMAVGKGQTFPVGLKAPNKFGLHDTLGNVWEWCLDQYEERRGDHCSERVVDPIGRDSGKGPSIRGGGWLDPANTVYADYHSWVKASARDDDLGFRLALVPECE